MTELTKPRPIFIVGAPRSGKSTLAWSLGQHPHLMRMEETNWIAKFAVDLGSTYDMGSARGPRHQLSAMGIRRAQFYASFGDAIHKLILSGQTQLNQSDSLADPSHTLPAQESSPLCSAAQAESRWIDDTPENSFYIYGLLQLFPQAKFIHVLRDAGSVAHALMNFSAQGGHDLTELAAYKRWLKIVCACLQAERAFGSQVILRVKSNDMRRCPEQIVRRCLDFLEESYCADCADFLQKSCQKFGVTKHEVAHAVPAVRLPAIKTSTEVRGGKAFIVEPLAKEAEELSEKLLKAKDPNFKRNQELIGELERAFLEQARFVGRLEAERRKAVDSLRQARQELNELRCWAIVQRVREAVGATLPTDATVLVVSRGDDQLLRLDGRCAWHFPQTEDGVYAGYHPADSTEAIAHLETLRAQGAEFLVFPKTSLWWLEHYAEFKEHLHSRYRIILDWEDACLIFALGEEGSARQHRQEPHAQTSRKALAGSRRTAAADTDIAPSAPGHLAFRCNICGEMTASKVRELRREGPSCQCCGSSLRVRAIIHALSLELFGKSLTLPDFPFRADIAGIGMTDPELIARPLAHKFNYSNTYYHKEPKLDITALVEAQRESAFDFIIASDVFEHVKPPISVAFENTCKLLKPGGVLIFTAPYRKDGDTVEHFPDLHDYQVIEKEGRYLLKNVTRDGTVQVFEDLVFHGGPGTTLEMRVFSESSLLEHFKAAGFRRVRIHREPCFEHGVYWASGRSLPISARVD